MLANSHAEAVALGVDLYWAVCRRGHLRVHSVQNRTCTRCAADRRAQFREHQRQYAREHYKARRQEYIERADDWRVRNLDKRRAIASKWVRDNPRKALLAVRKRQLAKLQRTPAWADLAAIEQFYMQCPVGMQVDHIIPLRGKLVSGLHVLNNLQYLTKEDNIKKLNSFDPWTFNA